MWVRDDISVLNLIIPCRLLCAATWFPRDLPPPVGAIEGGGESTPLAWVFWITSLDYPAARRKSRLGGAAGSFI